MAAADTNISPRETVRRAIVEADDLRRQTEGPVTQVLHRLRDALVEVDASMGGGRVGGLAAPYVHDLLRLVEELTDAVDSVQPELRHGLQRAAAGALAVAKSLHRDLGVISESFDTKPSLELPSAPLFGVLPLARIVPQDVHSLMDYAGGGLMLGTSLGARGLEGQLAGAALGTSVIVVSALTDYRLSAARVIPVEAHQAIDHLWGLAAIAAPFVFGYYKRDPVVAALHVLTGATTILASLVTDYRAAEGIGRNT